MTVRNWLELLIIPFALALVTAVFAWQQAAHQQDIEDRRAKRERNIENQRAQDEALQAYLDQMSTLLLEKNLGASDKYSAERTLARARTSTVLRRLGPSRKGTVVLFLHESLLINPETPAYLVGTGQGSERFGSGPVVDLKGVDLSEAELSGANLLEAELSGANLKGANLERADLQYAQGITKKVLEQQAKSLQGATMPDGQKYEEWIESKGSGKDGQNPGP
jgi:hypothetical protein